jgi:hypothetical protein
VQKKSVERSSIVTMVERRRKQMLQKKGEKFLSLAMETEESMSKSVEV